MRIRKEGAMPVYCTRSRVVVWKTFFFSDFCYPYLFCGNERWLLGNRIITLGDTEVGPVLLT